MLVEGREMVAVLGALAVYRGWIVPLVRRELERWRVVAAGIENPAARSAALLSIDQKGLNVEAAAVFATLAPWRARVTATRAMVALQVAIDYLDTLGERLSEGDGAYLERLFATYREEAGALPSHDAVAATLRHAVERCGEGQRHTHAAEHGDRAALEDWASTLDAPAAYRWWEVAAGASSSVAAHALVAAAADPRTTAAEAESIDAAYFPSIGALTVLLDDLVDREQDAAAGAHSYLSYCAGPEGAAARLGLIVRLARDGIAPLRHRHRHAAILTGIAGFYLSDAAAEAPYARPARERLLAAAGPTVRPIIGVMRRRRKRPEGAGSTSGP